MSLRGFGFRFDVVRGVSRWWYIDRDGVGRWSDNDELVPAFNSMPPGYNPTPDAPEPME